MKTNYHYGIFNRTLVSYYEKETDKIAYCSNCS